MIRFLGASSSLPNLPALIDLGTFDTFQIPYSCLAPQHHDLIAKLHHDLRVPRIAIPPCLR